MKKMQIYMTMLGVLAAWITIATLAWQDVTAKYGCVYQDAKDAYIADVDAIDFEEIIDVIQQTMGDED